MQHICSTCTLYIGFNIHTLKCSSTHSFFLEFLLSSLLYPQLCSLLPPLPLLLPLPPPPPPPLLHLPLQAQHMHTYTLHMKIHNTYMYM